MKNERLKQFASSFLVVLSLVVSSVSAACVCSSHERQASDDSYCQPQTKIDSAQKHSHEVSGEHKHENSSKNVSAALSEADECCCVQSAPRVYAKAEIIKIEKQATAITPFSPVEFVAVSQTAAVKTAAFAAPFYLSDSFHNLTPGRAPPRL